MNVLPNAKLIASDRFPLTRKKCTAIEEAMHHYEDPRAASIDALKLCRKITAGCRTAPSPRLLMCWAFPPSDVEGVATFYNMIFRQPVGRHVITVCDSIGCFLTGSEDLIAAIKQALRYRVGPDHADGRFTLLPICCLGNCDKGPTLMIDKDTHGPVAVRSFLTLAGAVP
jgi:NADH-quinone oxidoreductase subunit E